MSVFLSVVGVYCLVFYLYDVLKAPCILLFYFLKKCVGSKDFDIQEKYGNWAAITGSTDGIGKEYARELAARGINVVLISRNPAKLDGVAKEIERDFKVETKIIVADFSKGKEACKFVETQLDLTPIRILVNNVGQTTANPGPAAAFSDEELWDVILTNCGAVTQLSRYFIRRMHREAQKGILVNVSSGVAHFPVPNNAVYGATKAYARSLSLALQEEARVYGVDVQILSPHFVATKFIGYCDVVKYSDLILPNAKIFARAAVARLGKVEQTTGYFQHDIEYALLQLLPWRLAFFFVIFFWRALRSYIDARKL